MISTRDHMTHQLTTIDQFTAFNNEQSKYSIVIYIQIQNNSNEKANYMIYVQNNEQNVTQQLIGTTTVLRGPDLGQACDGVKLV